MDRSLSCKTSFDDLPDGLVVDILSRLPVKMIIQSTCVSKLWYSIIKTPSFVSSQLSRSISNCSGYYVYMFREYSPSITVISDNHLLTHHPDFVFPFEIESTSLQLIGTCNGLVCAAKDSRDIYLINPFIRKYKKLALESSCYANWIKKFDHTLAEIQFGFGYSEVESDYKVVRIFNHYPGSPWVVTRLGDSVYDPHKWHLKSKVEIYSLKSGEWKSVDISFELSSHYSPVFVDGCLYWSAYQSSGPDTYLVCFDLNDQVFSRIEFPPSYLQLDSTFSRNILIKNGSVAVVVFNNDRDIYTRIYMFALEKKNVGGQVQWKESYYECDYFDAGDCLGFSGVGRLLFVDLDNSCETNYIVAVDLDNSCAMEKLAMGDADDIIYGVTNVLESLVLLLDSTT